MSNRTNIFVDNITAAADPAIAAPAAAQITRLKEVRH